ncbi:hypothetical protein MRX96_022647 [Rhipicephalus microplus]
MTSATAPPLFWQTPDTSPMPWAKRRRVFQAYVDVDAGDTSRPAFKKSLLLNALGDEGLDVYWTLRNAQDQAESGDGTTGSLLQNEQGTTRRINY